MKSATFKRAVDSNGCSVYDMSPLLGPTHRAQPNGPVLTVCFSPFSLHHICVRLAALRATHNARTGTRKFPKSHAGIQRTEHLGSGMCVCVWCRCVRACGFSLAVHCALPSAKCARVSRLSQTIAACNILRATGLRFSMSAAGIRENSATLCQCSENVITEQPQPLLSRASALADSFKCSAIREFGGES